MRTCRDTAALITKTSFARLSLREWLALRLHLLICRMCRRHKRQTDTISQATQRLLQRKHMLSTLSDPARQRIRQAIEKYTGNS